MKPKPLLLTAALALLLAGCQSDPKTETATAAANTDKTAPVAATAAAAPTPAAVKAEAAGKTGEKKSSALDALLGGGKRPSLVDTDSFNETEREIIRAQERERARDPQKLGPGVYDKESKARKDWVF